MSMTFRPLVYAHRGDSRRFAENTVAAFAGAVAAGADGVELDVRPLADGALAVHHDARLPDGRAVADCRTADLPAHVPLLAGALGACGDLLVNVEIKNAPGEPGYDPTPTLARAVAAGVDAWGGRVLVSSFDRTTLDQLGSVAPHLPRALLTFALTHPAAVVASARAAGCVALHPYDATVDAALVGRCHRAGLAVNVWTVDDPARIRALAALGVDGICTNTPAAALAALASPCRELRHDEA